MLWTRNKYGVVGGRDFVDRGKEYLGLTSNRGSGDERCEVVVVENLISIDGQTGREMEGCRWVKVNSRWVCVEDSQLPRYFVFLATLNSFFSQKDTR